VALKTIKLSEENYERIKKDRDHFTKVIGYKFSINDTLTEYYKIMRLWEKPIKKFKK